MIDLKVREEAAVMCGVQASWWATTMGDDLDNLRPYEGEFSAEAVNLAETALCNAPNNPQDTLADTNACDWAEAEAMLREGWSP